MNPFLSMTFALAGLSALHSCASANHQACAYTLKRLKQTKKVKKEKKKRGDRGDSHLQRSRPPSKA